MTGGTLAFLLFAVLIPLLVNEAGDLAPSLARCLLRWGARRIGRADQAERYEEERLADLERVPGKLIKLIHACGVLIRSVRPLRAQFRQRPRRARLPGSLSGRIMDGIGRELGGSREISLTLQHVAEVLVPQFADHCFIDLFQGDELIRHVQQNAGDWTPPPGTWARVGEQIRYPQGHFCQQAMARRDTIAANIVEEYFPAPSAQSAAAAYEVGLTSIVAAPLCTHEVLLGVLSVARSNLTSRTERFFTTADRDLIAAVARRVATAIGDAVPPEAGPQTALAMQNLKARRLANVFLAPRSLG